MEQPTDGPIELTATVIFKRRGVETKLVLLGIAHHNHSARYDPMLIKAIARSRPGNR
jgi:hypothetical protein